MENSLFLNSVVDGLMVSPFYIDEEDRLFDIGMLKLVFKKLQIEKFMDDYDLSLSDYEKYFQGIMDKKDFFSTKELENKFKNIKENRNV